jgi:hypothetical protein
MMIRTIMLLLVITIVVTSETAEAASLTWGIQQLTHFSPGLDDDLLPDINDKGEVIYSQRIPALVLISMMAAAQNRVVEVAQKLPWRGPLHPSTES